MSLILLTRFQHTLTASVTGQEGHSTVAALRGAIPDRWRAASTPASATSAAICAADGLNFTAVCEEDAGFEALADVAPQVTLLVVSSVRE